MIGYGAEVAELLACLSAEPTCAGPPIRSTTPLARRRIPLGFLSWNLRVELPQLRARTFIMVRTDWDGVAGGVR